MNRTWIVILGSIISFALSLVVVELIRRVGVKRGLLAVPNARSSHTTPTPTSGGLAIVLIVVLNILIYAMFNTPDPKSIIFLYLVGGIGVSFVSWIDDLHPIRNRWRFAVHTFGAALVVFLIGHWKITSIPILGTFDLHWLAIPISLIWIIGLTNAYNFMDGIDGIAGGQAVVAGLGWAFLGWWKADPLIELLGLSSAAASLGFLWHNWPPARIFMGDVGSAFLGFSFAFLAILGAMMDHRLALAGILFVWPFIFDSMFTFFRRLKNGENVFSAHRSHLYQRLTISGYSHRFVSSLYVALAAWGAIGAILWLLHDSATGIVVIYTIPVLCLLLWLFVVSKEQSRSSVSKVPNVLDQTDPVSR